MAETIAEVFIRLGTSGVGDAQKKIEGVEKSLQDLGQSAKLAFTAMNPQIIDNITSKQDELRQKFDAGSISIHEFVAELRALGQESKVALASFGQREGMAGGILSRFGLGPDANQQAEAAKKLIEQLTAAGHYTPEQQGALFSAVDLKRDEALYGEALDNMVRQRERQAAEEERIQRHQSQLRENSISMEQQRQDKIASFQDRLRNSSLALEEKNASKVESFQSRLKDNSLKLEESRQREIERFQSNLRENSLAMEQRHQDEVAAYQQSLRDKSLSMEQRHQDAKEKAQLAALDRVSKEMSAGLKQEASEREAAQKRALQAVSREMGEGVKDVRKGEAEAIQRENAAKLRGIEITRQFESEQERFNRVKAEYTRLLIAGEINLQTYDRALLHLNSTLDHNSNLMANGKKMTGMAGVGFQQLSYAAQDFVQVMDQGVGRALQASANNLAMVIPLLVKSAGLGAGLAIGFTALSTAVTMWERSASKAKTETEKFNEALEKLPETLRKVAEAQRATMSMRDLLFEGSATGLEQAARERGRGAAVARESAGVAAQAARDAAARATADVTGGRLRQSINDPEAQARFRDDLVRQNVVGLTRAAAQSGVPDTPETQASIQRQAEIAADREIKSIKDKVAATEDVRKAVDEEVKAGAEANRLRKEQVELQKAHVEAVNAENYALEKEERAKRKSEQAAADAAIASEKFSAAERRRGSVASIERGMMSEPMQRAMSVFDDFQQNIEAIAGGGGGPEEIMAAGGLFQQQLDALAKDNKPQFRPGMTGFSEFGQQFQQALFQDPAEKDRKEQLRLQREANAIATRMAESLAGGLVSGPALFGGGGGN